MRAEVVLVVDYADSIRQAVVAALHSAGYAIVEADTAALALDIVRDRQVDLLICNIIMPGMSGIELVLAARSIRPDIKVLLTTGQVRSEAEAALPVDASELPMPDAAQPERLISEVNRIFRRREQT